MTIHRTCDGIRRRDFLKAGAFGAAASLSLPSYLRLLEAGEVRDGGATAAIFINLQGGPSHIDTFDLKPDAPQEYRGEFKPIKTSIPGIEISEHLPKLAQCVDKFAILRGVSHSVAAHRLGQAYVTTGNIPLPSLEYPSYGSVITKELPGPLELPSFVAVPRTNMGPGFLGVKYAPLNTGNVPQSGKPYTVRGISMADGLTVTEVEKRHQLLDQLDQTFHGYEADDQLLAGLDRFGQQAYAMITSPKAREAFDVSREAPSFAKPFGDTPFGQSCLLASRLVESGVRFVTISSGGWDTHRDNWNALKNRLLPPFDEGLAALLTGLEQKGLLETTAVFVTGEFGRTPKINTQRNGRDHFARAMFMLQAGGKVRGGQVIGASDDKATGPLNDGFTPNDVAASLYYNLGIDYRKEYHSDTGRPIMILRDGDRIPELFS